MNSRVRRTWLGSRLILMAAVASSLAAGSDRAAAQEPTTTLLELSSDEQAPGGLALVSLRLRLPDGVSVGKAESDIAYPGKWLVFDGVRRGLSAEAVEAEVTATPEQNGEVSTLRVTVTAKEGELPPGTLADIRFKIDRQVPKDTKIALKNTAFAWSNQQPPAPIEPVTATDGEINILSVPPQTACLFYMH